jgi:Putative MetA-pathway of phenol degradation
MSRGRASAILGIFVFLIWPAGIAPAQDLEPRAYAASPVGLSFLAVIAGHSSGGVVVDPSLPVEDAEATVNSLGVGLGTTFDLFGRTALAVAALPLAWADASGRVGENAAEVSRAGLADPRIKLSLNLVGGRALVPSEFARAPRRTIVGVSLTAIPPLGQYDRTKLINLGANRWAFKPEIGISRLVRSKWTLDGYAGIWMATANDEFYPGASHRTQRPIVALQAHVSYTARPRLWIAADGTWYSGGRTTVDGVEKGDLQRNSRLGATLSLPIARQQSLKVTGSAGATTRIGSDFRTIAVAWQMSWLH